MLKWIVLVIVSGILAGETTKNMHSPCRILINEVSFSSPPFIEVAKICPESATENTHVGLGGYGLVILDASSLELKFHKSLDRIRLNTLESSESTVTSKPHTISASVPSSKAQDAPRKAAAKETTTASQTGASVSVPSPSSSASFSTASTSVPRDASRIIVEQGHGSTFHHGLPVGPPSSSSSTSRSSAPSVSQDAAKSAQEKGQASSVQKGAQDLLPHPPPPPFDAPDKGESVQTVNKLGSKKGSNSAQYSLPSALTVTIPPSNTPQSNIAASLLPGRVSSSFHVNQPSKAPQPPTVVSTSQTPQSTPIINVAKGEKVSVDQTTSGKSPCSSPSPCSSAPKKPRRSKRDTQFIQPNVRALKDVDLGAISLEESKTYVVALVYLPTQKRSSLWDRYRVGSILSPEMEKEIKEYMYDLLILSGTEESDVSNSTKILPEGADLTYIEPLTEVDSYSFSKCDKTLSPFNPEGFIHSEQTRGKPNLCPVYEEPDPFSFRGTNLKIQCQKLVVNAVTNLRKKLKDESWRKLNPVEAAASILNLSRSTIYNIIGKYEAGVEFTEGKKQCRRKPTTTLEPKWQALLYKTITGEYERNRVARVAYVLKAFVQAVRTQQLQELEEQLNSRSDPTASILLEGADSTTPPTPKEHDQPQDGGSIVDFDEERQAPELYHCSARSFTKILDRYGYKYGKIRNRDSQIFRPVNLKWREMYLTAIEKYDADPAWNVVYLDETWVDPHQRANRGIVLKKYENFQQRKDFTFKDDKISRGSRLIILAAGGADGFVHGATEVFVVSVNAKKKRSDPDTECSSSVLPEDYHDNVKGPKFMQWLEKLFKLLENKKTVFVMDNCPFHKVLGIPKTSDKKEVIRKWLEEKKAEGHDVTEDISSTTKLTKMALLGIVGRLTTDDSSVDTKIPRTQVQQLARQYGHRVLLLPPYNCDLNPIEYVWNDVKREVKEKNTDQTVALAMDLAKRAISVYTKEQWQKHIGHTKKLRNEYREGDKVFSTMQTTLDNEEAAAEELSDADYSAIDQEVTGGNEEECFYDELE